MAGFDALAVSSHAVPIDMMNFAQSDLNGVSQVFPQDLGFTGEALFDDVQDSIPPISFTPSYELDGFPASFDDPLSYHANIFDTFLDDDNINMAEEVPTETDSGKLLGFGTPIHKTPVFDQSGQTWPRMTAELNGMFCVAEDVFEGDTAGHPLELTCYRRNLFAISASITLSRTASQVLLDQCRRVPIFDLVATLSATESIEGKLTDIIAVPWKTGGANGASTEEKTGTAPSDIPIDLSSNQETDPMFVSIPISWGRLQFKYATANNGRRKGLQQHYRIQITLLAKLEGDGHPIKLAEIQSNPIVVRGRSPKNFDSSKDVPLTERKTDSANRARGSSVASTPQWIEPALSQSNKYYSAKSVQPLDVSNWADPTPSPTTTEHRSKKVNTSPITQRCRPPIPQTQWEAEPLESSAPPSIVPMGLSLSDEESTRSVSSSVPQSATTEKPSSRVAVTSPVESADHLYEYFPLSLDDWMPPVDAIYRPHIVHHLRLPQDPKAHTLRAKPKRYFAAED